MIIFGYRGLHTQSLARTARDIILTKKRGKMIQNNWTIDKLREALALLKRGRRIQAEENITEVIEFLEKIYEQDA